MAKITSTATKIARLPKASTGKNLVKKKTAIKKIIAGQKRKKIRALRVFVRAKKRKRSKGLFGFRWARPSSTLIVDYLEYNGRLTKVDSFTKLRPGALVKVMYGIDARSARPRSRDGVKSYKYLMKILVDLPQGTHLMFMERHPKFPEWYKFLVFGGRTVWVDISDYVDFLSIMRKPKAEKKKLR